MMGGFLPILMAWVTFMKSGTTSPKGMFPFSRIAVDDRKTSGDTHNLPGSLLQLSQLTNDDIEMHLPQIVNRLLDWRALEIMGKITHDRVQALRIFENAFLRRCAENFSMGFKALCKIKAEQRRSSIWKKSFSRYLNVRQYARARVDAARELKCRLHQILSHERRNSHSIVELETFTNQLSQLCTQLERIPEHARQQHLTMQLNRINSLLHHQAHVRLGNETDTSSIHSWNEIHLALPFSSRISGHLADAHSSQTLNVIVEKCVLLPSKEHSPFLVYAEMVKHGDKHLPSDEFNSSLQAGRMVGKNNDLSGIPGQKLNPFIVKCGRSINREELALQFVRLFQAIFKQEGVEILLRPYSVMSIAEDVGLIEFINGFVPIDLIKKSLTPKTLDEADNMVEMDNIASLFFPKRLTIAEYFQSICGENSSSYFLAQENFARSLAGYSLVTYVLQVKDRHNGNIMLDPSGHLVHIDYGFILGDSPGFNFNFESAPFKLTAEYIEFLGGVDSPNFHLFEKLFTNGIVALQKHAEKIVALAKGSMSYPVDNCEQTVLEPLRERLGVDGHAVNVESLIQRSMQSYRTSIYDWIQENTNNILM